jgi:WD40 repeat protein
VAFSGDGRHLASAAAEWPFSYRERELRAKDNQRMASLSAALGVKPKPQFRSDLGSSGELIIWDAIEGKALHTLRGKTGAVTSLAFRPKSNELAWASGDEGLLVFGDSQSGQKRREVKGEPPSDREFVDSKDLREAILGMAFDSDGARLAVAGENDGPAVLDVESGSELRRFEAEVTGSNNALAFSPDGRYLAYGGLLTVWDSFRGQCVFTRKREQEGLVLITAVVFTSDSKRLVSGGGDGLITVWDLETGQETLRLKVSEAATVAVRTVIVLGEV